MYKYVNNMFPELIDFFSNVTDLHPYDTRHANRNSFMLLSTVPHEDNSLLVFKKLYSQQYDA